MMSKPLQHNFLSVQKKTTSAKIKVMKPDGMHCKTHLQPITTMCKMIENGAMNK